MDCIFCGIVSGAIPSRKIYEDEYTLAFLDIANDIDGHTLVIPKKHTVNMLDCDIETLNQVMNTVRLVSNHYAENCGYDGIGILNANGKAAQQTVFHFHVHIIPRKNDDNQNAWPSFKGCNHSIDEMFEKLKMPEL